MGPLATAAEPHSYDLCAAHALRLTAPKGWEVVRPDGLPQDPGRYDDLEALANAVREAGRGDRAEREHAHSEPVDASASGPGRRGHLRVLRFPEP